MQMKGVVVEEKCIVLRLHPIWKYLRGQIQAMILERISNVFLMDTKKKLKDKISCV